MMNKVLDLDFHKIMKDLAGSRPAWGAAGAG